MRILHVEDPFSLEERAEKKADIRQNIKQHQNLSLTHSVTHHKNKLQKLRRCDSYTIEELNNGTARLLVLDCYDYYSIRI